jgi:tetratricopeptide (TPR) repeat protein
MTALPTSLEPMRELAHPRRLRLGRRVAALLRVAAALILLGLVPMLSGLAHADDPVKGEVKVFTTDGFARLIFKLDHEVKADVHETWPIMMVTFAKPVDISVDRISGAASDYISAARVDPDGATIRLALKKRLKINTTPAGDRLFVDLLPESWKGVLPGLPKEVIAELAQRAAEADRLRNRQQLANMLKTPTIRVKVATQPTFIRYVFELPDGANVVPEKSNGALKLHFDRKIKWDLADVLSTLPPALKSVSADTDFDSVVVTFALNGKPEVRTFREDNSIAVDVGLVAPKPKSSAALEVAKPAVAKAAPAIEAPKTVPAAKDKPAEQVKNPEPAPPAKQTRKAAAAAPLVAALAIAMPAALNGNVERRHKSDNNEPAAAASASAEMPKKVAVEHPRPPPDPNAPVVAGMQQTDNGLRLEFPFAVPTPAAVFRRADTLWLVFDTASKIDLAALATDSNQAIRSSTLEHDADGATIVRIRLQRPQLASLTADGPSWILTIGDSIIEPTRPVSVSRDISDKDRGTITIKFDDPRKVHRLNDPDIGDRLMVVTALGPARGFVKGQDFVELRTLPSTHGIVVQPLADDVTATLSSDKITISRPGGLMLSSSDAAGLPARRAAGTFQPLLLDTQLWGVDRQAKFNERRDVLVRQAAEAPPFSQYSARLNLARFYLAQGMSAEAKSVLDVALDGQRPGTEDVTGSVLRAVSNVMLHRPDEALKDLSESQVGNQLDAPIWRAVALAEQGQWVAAYTAFKGLSMAGDALPVELQEKALQAALRSAIEVRDFSAAAKTLHDLESIGVSPAMKPSVAVLTGRLDEGFGRKHDALAAYRAAAESDDPAAAAQGHLHEIMLRVAEGDLKRKDAIAQLETLTTVWRGDETEVEGLKLLAHLYTKEGQYREAFHVMRTALLVFPNSDITRQIEDEAAATFDSLFLTSKGDSLPAIEALGLFYDYRDLTPIGRRGDEMIRRLADRLVSVDLLDQAAELLQHQIDHRLQGAGRAQVATRLATIYLMNHKPDRALATLQSTRIANLANELHDQRLLLEVRALSDLGRYGLALELVSDVHSHEAIRLRADILWAAKNWHKAAEQIELLYGDRWKDFRPLTETERNDILRAAIGYSLSDDSLGLARFRQRYAPKMADGPDRHAFEIVTTPVGSSDSHFRDVAQKVAGVDTLDAFLQDMRTRYPGSIARKAVENGEKTAPAVTPPTPAKPQAEAPASAAPAAETKADTPAKPASPAKPDAAVTGSIP